MFKPAMETKTSIPLLIAITLMALRKIHAHFAQSCEQIQGKSSDPSCVEGRYNSWTQQFVCDRYGYPTLYYVICRHVTLEAGTQLSIQNHINNDFNYITFEDSVISKVPVGVFAVFTNVQKMFLNDSQIDIIEPGAFGGMTNLEELHLENNNITKIVRGILNSLTNLKILDLSNNNLLTIEDHSLHGLLSLQNLKLDKNHLNNFTSSTVSSLSALKNLDLSCNHIQIIEENPFSNLLSLEELLLNNNCLEHISVLTFRNTTALRILDVSFNEITEIDFSYWPALEKLNFANNKLDDVKNWSKLQNFKTINMHNNSISEIKPIGKGIAYLYLHLNKLEILNSSLFSHSENLNTLDLSHNIIKIIKDNTFAGLSELEFLCLNNNRLEHLPIGCFKDLSWLSYLYLSYNFLTDLEFGTFVGLSNLKELSLVHNNLITVYENSFHVFGQLQTLGLDNNEINSIDAPNLLLQLPNLKEITLNNNNWTCNSLSITVNVFKNRSVNVHEGGAYNLSNIYGIPCRNEKKIRIKNNHISTPAIDIETTTISGIDFENSEKNCLKTDQDDYFRSTSFYEYFDQGFKNSSFYSFFNSNYISSEFANYLEKGFNDSQVFKYFDRSFTDSSFYNFFNNDYINSGFSKNLQNDFKNSKFFKYFDRDFFNSSFFKYFNENFKNTDFYKVLSNSCSNSKPNYENFKILNAKPLKLVEPEYLNMYLEAFATKVTILLSAVVVLIFINTSMFLLLLYRLNFKPKCSKTEEYNSNLEANIELM